jgi:hypothetical protein
MDSIRCGDAELFLGKLRTDEPLEPGASPSWRDREAEKFSGEEGYTRRESARLTFPGGTVEALRLSGNNREDIALRYLAEHPLEPGWVRVASCTFPRDTPEGRTRCEHLLSAGLQYGATTKPPREFLLAQLEALVGGKVALPEDCDVRTPPGGKRTSLGGKISCKGRLDIEWEPGWEPGSKSASPAEFYERLARAFQEKPQEGQTVEALTCNLRGQPTPCLRRTYQDEEMGPVTFYMGALREEPARLISCSASDSAPALRDVCERLFKPMPSPAGG